MADIREELVLAIHNAEFMCRVEHGCKTEFDCYNCIMANHDCTKGYIADYLLEQFDIKLWDGDYDD